MKYELIIIGGGPAGAAAGVYAARKHLKTLLIAGDFGGQSVVSQEIQNWLGTTAIAGPTLAENFKAHLHAYKDEVLEIREGEYVQTVSGSQGAFTVTTSAGSYEAEAVLITTGSQRKKLTVPGAAEFENKGITYCASCDGPLFTGKAVAVIGGGNAGFETAAQLLAYCPSVTLLHNSERFKADPVSVARITKHPNMHTVLNTELLEVTGTQFVNGLRYRDRATGEEHTLAVEGVFSEIGNKPTTDMVKGLVELTDYGSIKVDPRTQRTNTPGVWAAGDCTDGLYHQNNIAAGDGVKALEDIYLQLKAK